MSQVQSGILPEHCRAAIWIEANVKGDVDALRAASRTFADKLATFEVKFPDANLGAVVAFGNNTWRALSGVGAEELKDFIPYGKGLAPATQYDVLIHILSLRHDVNFFCCPGGDGSLWRLHRCERRSSRLPLGGRTRPERLCRRDRESGGRRDAP
ncbi:putative dye-decolorizing peroxidase (DyP)YfeX-like subgroup [Salmonella enterica subsp. arizonae]|nr:putative dye-decolorizing peroxidase (DyP)YfeX-like subgroup [Salmonella enterica subsp. arizonae]